MKNERQFSKSHTIVNVRHRTETFKISRAHISKCNLNGERTSMPYVTVVKKTELTSHLL